MASPSAGLLFEAIKTRWEAKSLDTVITGSITEGQVAERTPPPYAEIGLISDVPNLWTNVGRYDLVVFQITVVSDTPAAASDLLGQVENALDFASLGLNGGAKLVEMRPGAHRRIWDDDRQRASSVREWKAKVGRSANYNPA